MLRSREWEDSEYLQGKIMPRNSSCWFPCFFSHAHLNIAVLNSRIMRKVQNLMIQSYFLRSIRFCWILSVEQTRISLWKPLSRKTFLHALHVPNPYVASRNSLCRMKIRSPIKKFIANQRNPSLKIIFSGIAWPFLIELMFGTITNASAAAIPSES